MSSWLKTATFTALSLWSSSTNAACYDPSPAFPPPTYDAADPILTSTLSEVRQSLISLISSPTYNTTSFSIQVTSTDSLLWATYATARETNSTRPGADVVDGTSAFRIASITKTFTTLALLQLHSAGNLSLDDPVNKYLPSLTGSLPWKDITLRILASQLSGIPRDWSGSQGDLLTEIPEAVRFGLPPALHNNPSLPDCYNYSPSFRPCTAKDLYRAIHHLPPVYAPNFKSTYSNMAFEILGLVIANVSGTAYEDYIQTHVLDLIGMNHSSFKPPPDSVAVLPKGNAWFWDVNEGIHNPTGGLYSTADDLSLYLRYVLTHFNAIAPGVNWLQPHSFTWGGESSFGMPWEIFRTTTLLDSWREVTFYTKSGGEPGYVSIIIAVPDYGLGVTILVAGAQEEIMGLVAVLRERVTVPLIRAAEKIAARDVIRRYTGRFVFESSTYTEERLNSSLTLSYDGETGLTMDEWISNGTEVLKAFTAWQPSLRDPRTRAQLTPTLLYEDEESQEGEKWRVLIVPPRKEEREGGVWDGFCITDVDILMYDGKPLNEMVFYIGEDGIVGEVQLTAFKVRLTREVKEELVVQEL